MEGIREYFSSGAGMRTRFLENGVAHSVNGTLVLLHDGAWGGCAEATWGRMLGAIDQDIHMVAPDFLGFGKSDKVVFLDRSPYQFRSLAILDLLDELGVRDNVHLVGNSFGGSVALRSITMPAWSDRLASVTSVSGTGGPWRTDFALTELSHFNGTVQDMVRIAGCLTDTFDGFQEYVEMRCSFAKLPGHYRCMLAPHLEVPEAVRDSRTPDSYPSSLADGIPMVCLIAGDRDSLLEEGWAERLAAHVPGRSSIHHMNARHSPNLSDPDTTWAVIKGFIAAVRER